MWLWARFSELVNVLRHSEHRVGRSYHDYSYTHDLD